MSNKQDVKYILALSYLLDKDIEEGKLSPECKLDCMLKMGCGCINKNLVEVVYADLDKYKIEYCKDKQIEQVLSSEIKKLTDYRLEPLKRFNESKNKESRYYPMYGYSVDNPKVYSENEKLNAGASVVYEKLKGFIIDLAILMIACFLGISLMLWLQSLGVIQAFFNMLLGDLGIVLVVLGLLCVIIYGLKCGYIYLLELGDNELRYCKEKKKNK